MHTMNKCCGVCGRRRLFIILLAALSVFISSLVSLSGFHTSGIVYKRTYGSSDSIGWNFNWNRSSDETRVVQKDKSHSDKITPVVTVGRRQQTGSFVSSLTHRAAHSLLYIRERFEKRRSAIRLMCQKMRLWKKPLTTTETRILYYNMLVDDKHRILYCYLPKAACTSWKKVFQVLTGKAKSTKEISGTDAHNRKRFMFLKDLTSSDARKRLSSYTKMMVHREPMMRFVSAYISKFVVPDKYFVRKFGTLIIQLYRRNAKRDDIRTGRGVRFDEFSRYVVDNAHKALNFDGHWRPAAYQCQPCSVDYDYISSTDTADEDAAVILKSIRANGIVTFPHDNKSRHSSNSQQHFSKLPQDVVKKLIEVYRRDFTLFGYKRPSVNDLIHT